MPPSDGKTGGAGKPCASCGRALKPGTECPDCGPQPADLAAELAELDKALSEMAASNVELDKQRKSLAGKMQAAKHQRDILARAAAGQPTGTRRPAGGRRAPAQGRRTKAAKAGAPSAARPAMRAGPTIEPMPATGKPEASSRSVQAIMLALGALLLGVAAIAFVGVAITTLDAWGLLAIIIGVCALALGIAPALARRSLTSTGEAVAAVGLLFIAVAGYALWTTETVVAAPQSYAGLVAATTAVIGYGYHRLTRLVVPRYGALLALQFVLPLLAYQLITGLVGWAIVFTLVAAHNAGFGHLDRYRAIRAIWPQYLAWVLHGLALGAAAGYATTALALAETVPAAATAGAALVAATAVGVVGTLSLRHQPLPDVAAGLMTLALMIAAARVALVAAPADALLPVAFVVAVAGLASRLLPERARRGPQLASTLGLGALGAYVALLAGQAAAAVVVLPPWPADPAAAGTTLVPAAPAGWQLTVAAATLTVAAVAALPPWVRREGATAGVALTALSLPASFALPANAAAWVLVTTAAGIALAGLETLHRRTVTVHLAAAGVVGLVAVGASLSRPALTSGILAAVAITGAVLAIGPTRSATAAIASQWAGGAAGLALPGAAATGAAALGAGTPGILAAASAGACGSLAYAVRLLLARRIAPVPVTMGAGLGALACAAAAFVAGDATAPDFAITGLVVLTATLVYATPRIDATRRRDRYFDGADLAAAALTAAVVATLARIIWLALPDPGPDGALLIAATLVAIIALVVRMLPRQWRHGPLLGVGAFGALVAGLAAAATSYAAANSLIVLSDGDLGRWPPATDLAGLSWAPPASLGLLAVTAAVVLPRGRGRWPGSSAVSATLATFATIGLAPALALPWWAPAATSAAVATAYALSAVGLGSWRPPDPRAARARALAAAAIALYAVGASIARPWTIAAVLGLILLVGVVLAVRTATLPGLAADPRLAIGGTAAAAALLAAPGALAALTDHLRYPGDVRFLAALAAPSLGLAAVAALRARIRPLLPYCTVGIAAGATLVALMSVPTAYPTGVYAAAAVLLAVLAELIRAERTGRGGATAAPRLEVRGRFGPRLAGWVSPAIGALLASAIPIVVALVGMAPALHAALIDPHEVLAAPWTGPPAALLQTGHVPATNALAALLLTLASALAAAGFGGAVTRQTVPVIAPGLALTLLISPAALGLPWPASTIAGLVVFTFAMLGVALTAPPPPGARTRVLRINRLVVLGIGLAGGSAGLAGSLADPMLTWGTFGGAIAVGATAALGGRTGLGRLVGWLGAATAAQAFALTTALLVGVPASQAGLFLLPVAAVGLLLAARLPQLRARAARLELRVIEWVGGYLPLGLGVAIALGSPPDLAAVLFGTGLVLGGAALRPDHTDHWRRILLWAAAASEVGATWILMWMFGVQTLEAYTVPLAVFALLVGTLEVSRRPELSSWIVYGPGLIAALAPSLVMVVFGGAPQPMRQAWVLLGATAALLFGSRSRQRAPVIIGAAVLAAGSLHLLSLAGPYLVLIPIGLLLFYLGGKSERRQRDLEQIRGALYRMR